MLMGGGGGVGEQAERHGEGRGSLKRHADGAAAAPRRIMLVSEWLAACM